MSSLNEMYPTNIERFNFMKGLVRVARADSKISLEEEAFFVNASNTLGLDQDQISTLQIALNNVNDEFNLGLFFSQKSQSIFLIKEAIQLCFIDGRYSAKEKEEIRLLAEELSIETFAVESLEQWVEEGIAWTQQGDKLLMQLSEN